MEDRSPAAAREPLAAIDTTVPQPARFWDYMLGGKDNYPIDREVGEQVLRTFPICVTPLARTEGSLSGPSRTWSETQESASYWT